MPEEATDYDVADGLPEDQDEEEAIEGVTLKCRCGAEIWMIVGNPVDLLEVANANRWIVQDGEFDVCPRCR